MKLKWEMSVDRILPGEKNGTGMGAEEHIAEVRWHGRGGQGAVLGATILGRAAALYEGKYAMSFPSFGAERRGAPVMAFTRISSRPLRSRNLVQHPTILVVLDDTLFGAVKVTEGAEEGAHVLVNTRRPLAELSLPDSLRVSTLDATTIARETLGLPIVNTAMLGALVAATNLVGLDPLKRAIGDVLPERLVERNIAAAQAAYEGLK